MVDTSKFKKSDIGAQAAWKGFSSQTLYIASRIVTDADNNYFYPEDIEDLVVKNNEQVIEAIQIKNIVADLTLSSLSSTKSSTSGEGFFNRVCSLHSQYPDFCKVKVVYFASLGDELNGIETNNVAYKKSVKDKLVNNHKLSDSDADWLISSLIFEKANISELEKNIFSQIKEYVATMAAPNIAKSLLVQHVSDMSKSKGCINKTTWKKEIHQIGVDISSIDGYYKEYNKSLVRLNEFSIEKSEELLRLEFSQGISTHPDHIRNNIDFRREEWSNVICSSFQENNIVIVKGVSGQGKTAICYRYLIENHPEELVFCIRHIESVQQVENLVVALAGLSKHTENLIIYIDVNPSETKWVLLLQEMLMRNSNILVLISIRDEDFNLTPVNGAMFAYKLIELQLSETEAELIYNNYTAITPHNYHRSFSEAWVSFGGKGTLIEFTYFLTNNQTLTERLRGQVNNLLLERIPDAWLEILKIVSLTGKVGGSISISKLKDVITCDNINAALKRFTDEYLIRETNENTCIEALHPIRATILNDLLNELIPNEVSDTLLYCIACINRYSVQYLLMEYFTEHSYQKKIVKSLHTYTQNDWVSFAGVIRALLWLDVKLHYEKNKHVVDKLILERGKGWLPLMPLDVSGLIRPNEIILESFTDADSFLGIDKNVLAKAIKDVKESLSSLHLDFEATDTFLTNVTPPTFDIENEDDCDAFGYSLFWFAKRNFRLQDFKISSESWKVLCRADFQKCANATRGLFEHEALYDKYIALKNELLERFLTEYCAIVFSESDDDIVLKFVPPVFGGQVESSTNVIFNHFWKIKALDIMQQIFPNKEYIDIELIGIDLLSDLEIQQLDYKVRIPKANRNDKWIVELNSWFISRVNYDYRPKSWQEYIAKMEKIRITSDTLISDTISCIDNLYKKQCLSKGRWDKISTGLKELNALTSKDLLLPISVVDKYCLFREDMQKENSLKEEGKNITSPLLYTKYKILKKEFTNTYNSIDYFFKNLADVISKRIKRTTLNDVNLNIGLLNLCNAMKSMSKYHNEFDAYFENYSTLDCNYNNDEIEHLNILLNMWRYVIETPPKGYQIAYDSKQKYKHATKIVEDLNIKIVANDIKVVSCGNKLFFLKDFDAENSEMITEYKHVAELIHKVCFNNIGQFSSEKFLVDKNDIEFIYVPLYNNMPINVAFSISSLRVFEKWSSDAMFPAEIDNVVYDFLNIDLDIIKKITKLNTTFGAFMLLIQQYNEIVTLDVEERSVHINGLTKFVQKFVDEMSNYTIKLASEVSILYALIDCKDEAVIECVTVIIDCINKFEALLDKVKNLKSIKEYETLVQNALVALMILQPYIIKSNKNFQLCL